MIDKEVNLTLCLHLHAVLSSADLFKINFFEKLFQESNQSVKQFGTKLFAKVISRRH